MDAFRNGDFEVSIHQSGELIGRHALGHGSEVCDIAEEEGQGLCLRAGLQEFTRFGEFSHELGWQIEAQRLFIEPLLDIELD